MSLATNGGPSIRKVEQAEYIQHQRVRRAGIANRLTVGIPDGEPGDSLTGHQLSRILPKHSYRLLQRRR